MDMPITLKIKFDDISESDKYYMSLMFIMFLICVILINIILCYKIIKTIIKSLINQNTAHCSNLYNAIIE